MYLSLIFGFGLIILINGKYLLVDVDVHKNAVLPTNENNNILARCDFPPCYPPPRNNLNQKLGCDFPPCHPPPRNNLNQKLGCDFPPCYPPPRNDLNQKLGCIPCLTCPGICTKNWVHKTRAYDQKFDDAKGEKILPKAQNNRLDFSPKDPSCITEQSSCEIMNDIMACCDGLFCKNGKCHKGNGFDHMNDDCSKMKCGENCIVEGDMVGMCNAKQECSFEYHNLGC